MIQFGFGINLLIPSRKKNERNKNNKISIFDEMENIFIVNYSYEEKIRDKEIQVEFFFLQEEKGGGIDVECA